MKHVVRLFFMVVWLGMIINALPDDEPRERRPVPPPIAEEPRDRRPVPKPPGFAVPPVAVPPPPQVGGPLPGRSPGDFQVEVLGNPKVDKNSAGTGFSIHTDGVWMTAQHVISGCQRIGVETRGRFRPAKLVAVHRNADLAVLTTRRGAPPIPFSERVMTVGEPGYGIGYPQFEKGIVKASLIARGRMRARGYGIDGAPTLRWQENWRRPARNQSLGGLSGGPMLNTRGEVVGVAVAESRRRRRVTTAAPVSLREMLSQVSGKVSRAAGGGGKARRIAERNVERSAEGYWASDAISRIYCDNSDRRDRRPLSRG